MYTIGELSKIVKISANALRYYHEIGLLEPMVTHNDNQYRYYSDEQVKDIMFIIELKQYGFTLNEIKEIMQNKSNIKFKQMLEQKRIKLDNEMARLKSSSMLLEKRILKINMEEDLKMKGSKILIVDDLELARMMIRNIVEEYGYTFVGEASNGEEAIEAYEKLKPDLVIMDVIMPIMDGIEAAKQITNKYKDARIIMCSALSNIQVILDSMKAGARDFVSKPLSSFRLMNAVVRGFDVNYVLDKNKIEYISSIIKKNNNEKFLSIGLNQEDIDILLSTVPEENENIIDFLNKLGCKYVNNNEHSISKSSPLEEKIIITLKDKFVDMAKKLTVNFSAKLGQEILVNLLTIESITLSEYKTLINDNSCIGSINYKTSIPPVYINLNGQLENEQVLLKELLNFARTNLLLANTNHDEVYISIGLDDLKMLDEDYKTVLISFKIEFEKGDKGFALISIPHSLL